MDRNIIPNRLKITKTVALRKESVDRNTLHVMFFVFFYKSLSARRAWIEISGVDFAEDWLNASLSARRAWIEIERPTRGKPIQYRSLSARRAWIEISGVDFAEDWLNGRSPQGERG